MIKNRLNLVVLCVFLFLGYNMAVHAQVPDPNLGLRAEWLRGAYGLNWKPARTENGKSESLLLTIKPLLEQIENLRTVDYIQLHLNESSTYSPVHLGPNDLLESFWEGDMSDGFPVNLVVPRAALEKDPFLELIEDVRAAGLKVQVYVNSSNMLNREGEENPDAIPNITERWKNWCDTDPEAQAFINSQSYHIDSDWPNRKYMFCYAEFILKDYAIRYGDLIDAWLFDSGRYMWQYNGDSKDSNDVEEQRIYQAFADACHVGNPDAAISFNNSPGSGTEGENPFSPATLFDDYMFGHPFNGGANFALAANNLRLIEWIEDRDGYVQTNDPLETRTWDDFVVGHIDPPMSTGAWNAGVTPTHTDEGFVDWYSRVLLNGGAMSPGLPLLDRYGWVNLIMQDYAINQLSLLDDYLIVNQDVGTPNWARQLTILPPAYIGQPYTHSLIEGVDFWDPEGDDITAILAVIEDQIPTWLTISESEPGVWTLSGNPTETEPTTYDFRLRVEDSSGGTDRMVNLKVEDYVAPPITMNVQIQALETYNYGLNTIANMISEEQTAPDGLATFKVSIKVTPPAEKAVISGVSGGLATEKAWGLGNGTDNNTDDLFYGSHNEWVESINSIEIMDFNANGGALTVESVTAFFKSITIVNGQSSNDFVAFEINGDLINIGNLPDQVYEVDLKSSTLINDITDFSIGTGNTSSTNKWSIEGVTVTLDFNNSLSVSDVEIDQLQSLKVFPNPAEHKIELNLKPVKTQIFDLTGKTLINDIKGLLEFDISGLNNGIYIIKVETLDGRILFNKFLKK